MTRTSKSSRYSSSSSIVSSDNSLVMSLPRTGKVRDMNMPGWPCLCFQYSEPSTLGYSDKEHDALQQEAKLLESHLQEAERKIYHSGGSHQSFREDVDWFVSLSHQILEVKIRMMSNWYAVNANYTSKEFNPRIRRER
ncbi:hypothetical protein ACHAPJ_011160 [Fusarium lateritium]